MPGRESLRLESLSEGLVAYVRLYGTVDETFNPKDFMAAINGRDVILNLKAITRFSSFGVREWVNAISELMSKVDRLLFVECSPAVVAQLNMISNFSSGASVVSVQAPYYCEQCGWDTEVTCDLTREAVDVRKPIACKSCSATMIFDDDEDSYFRFRADTKIRALDPHLIEFMTDFSRSSHALREQEQARLAPAEPATAPEVRGEVAPTAPEALTGSAAPESRERASRLVVIGPWLETWRVTLVAAVAALALALVVVLAVFAFRPSSTSMTSTDLFAAVMQFRGHLKDGRIEQAEAIVTSLQENEALSGQHLATLRAEIDEAERRRSAGVRSQILHAFKTKRYDQVVKIGVASHASEDTEVNFAMAESYRIMNRLIEAAPYYQQIIDDSTSDEPIDDALFWRGDALVAQGKGEQARAMYERVLELRYSEFRRSAKRRLKMLSKPQTTSKKVYLGKGEIDGALSKSVSESKPAEPEPEAATPEPKAARGDLDSLFDF